MEYYIRQLVKYILDSECTVMYLDRYAKRAAKPPAPMPIIWRTIIPCGSPTRSVP